MNKLRMIAAVMVLGILCGCATMPDHIRAEEATWQALNVIDAGQTATIARNPRHWIETDSGTVAMIGAHPCENGVYGVMAGYAVAHIAIAAGLAYEADRHPGTAWGVALEGFEAYTLGFKLKYVIGNERLGIGAWAAQR